MKYLLIYITAILVFSSCNNYYKAITINKPGNSASIDSLNKEHKYFILRDGKQAFAMIQLVITTDQETIECNLDSLPDEHKLHLTNGKKGKMIYGKVGPEEKEKEVLKEVHIYSATGDTLKTGPYSIAIDKLQKIEVLKKDKQRTNKSHTAGVIAFTVGIPLVLILVFGIAYGAGVQIF